MMRQAMYQGLNQPNYMQPHMMQGGWPFLHHALAAELSVFAGSITLNCQGRFVTEGRAVCSFQVDPIVDAVGDGGRG
jgi:hypothetical protein